MKREKSTILYSNISIKDYKRIREISKKTKSQIEIQSKNGIPFLLHKYRKRKIFIGFLILSFFILSIMSQFIWNIEISGNIEVSKQEILQTLSENGLDIGTAKSKINITDITNKVRLNRDDIAWIGISIKGTNAIVEVKEISKAPEIIKEDEFCNIVSDRAGMITKINVQNGTAVAKVGDIVKEGELLVNRIFRRAVYRDKVCSCGSGYRSKNLVFKKRKSILWRADPSSNRQYRRKI